MGCLQCVLGAIIIVMHAPEQGAADNSIETFKHLMLSVGFLVYASIAVAISLFLVFYCGPRWGKTNMLVYITICSLIGSLSVVFTQGIGGAIVHSFTVENQFTNWFVYIVLILTLSTLAIEIIYLNKALNIFNTAVVTPTYYVIFTTLTIVSSIVFYRGFDASPVNVVTCVFGFLIICSGVALLQHSRSEKPKVDPLLEDNQEHLLPVYDNEKYFTSDEEHRDDDDSISLKVIHDSGKTLILFCKSELNCLFIVDVEHNRTETSSQNRRAQNEVDPFTSRKLGLNKKKDSDRKGLINNNNWEDDQL